MSKLGFVTVSHEDYADGLVEKIRNKAVETLLARGTELFPLERVITGCKEAQRAGKELLREDVDGVILFLGSWVECSVAMALIREVEHLPLLLWGFPMTMVEGQQRSTGSYVTYTMFKGVMDRIGYAYKGILGDVADEATLQKAEAFAKAAKAYQRLKRSRVGLVGYTSMSIYTGTFDHVLMRVRIGPEIHHMDAYSLIRLAESTPESKLPALRARLAKSARIAKDVSPQALDKICRLYEALMEAQKRFDLDAVNVKCQYEFSKEYGMVMCVPLSLAADNGLVASCEGDVLNTVSMLMLHFLTGQVCAYGDAIHHEGSVLKLSPCGFMPFSLGRPGEQLIQNFMPNRGFAGVQTSFVMRPQRVTVMRLIEDVGDYHILYLTGQGLDTPLRDGCFPALDIAVDGDINRLLEHYAGQHYAICYGDVSQELEDLARILKIKTIRV